MPTLDHITLTVSDYASAKAFYQKALAPLGIQLVMKFGEAAGFGKTRKPDFWIGTGPSNFQKDEHIRLITPAHVAFAAETRAEVDAFHAAALAAGGKDGSPGVRRTTILTTMGPSFSIPTVITSRPCFTGDNASFRLRFPSYLVARPSPLSLDVEVS